MRKVKLLTVKETEVMTYNDYVEFYTYNPTVNCCSFDSYSEIEGSEAVVAGKIPVSIFHIQTGEVTLDKVSGKEIPVYSRNLYAIDPKLKEIVSCEFKQEIETLTQRISNLENENRFLEVVKDQYLKDLLNERSKTLWTIIKERFQEYWSC